MNFLHDLPDDARARLAEILSDPDRRGPSNGPTYVRDDAICGTRSGYAKHHRKQEVACEDCKRAERDYRRKRVAV